MSNGNWKSFGGAAFTDQEGYEKSLVGGSFFDLGSHEVVIEAVESKSDKNNNQYLKVTFGADGKTINHNVFLVAVDKKTNKERLNRGYSSFFAGGILPGAENSDLKFEAFNGHFPSNPSDLEALVGSRLNIKIAQQKKGFTVDKTENGYIVMDVETRNPVVLEDSVENMFEEHMDAKEIAEAQGLKRAWNEVISMYGIEGNLNVNVDLIKNIVSGKVQKKRVASM